MATTPTPTPQQPPNFYEAAAKGTSTAPKPAASSQDDQQWTESVEKLLSVFAKLEKLKPGGQDISKEVQAMAEILKNTAAKVDESRKGSAPAGSTPPPNPTPTPAA